MIFYSLIIIVLLVLFSVSCFLSFLFLFKLLWDLEDKVFNICCKGIKND